MSCILDLVAVSVFTAAKSMYAFASFRIFFEGSKPSARLSFLNFKMASVTFEPCAKKAWLKSKEAKKSRAKNLRFFMLFIFVVFNVFICLFNIRSIFFFQNNSCVVCFDDFFIFGILASRNMCYGCNFGIALQAY